jgi:outer membrane murein-binding lipoprotein Lpp
MTLRPVAGTAAACPLCVWSRAEIDRLQAQVRDLNNATKDLVPLQRQCEELRAKYDGAKADLHWAYAELARKGASQ